MSTAPAASPKHSDAIGYLADLAGEIDAPWFRMVCDLAATRGVSVLDEPTLETLVAIFTRRASYIGVGPARASVPASATAAPADSLEHLAGFSNFKLLGDTLEVEFKKRISLIFGANGSGKSSLCESLKVLATQEPPPRPLQNVRAGGMGVPEFRYKFKSDSAPQTWTPAVGYGLRGTTVKYFDTAIAVGNVKNAVDPGRVILLTPFKLHVFDWAQGLTLSFREALQRAQQGNSAKLTETLSAIRTGFTRFKDHPLAVISEPPGSVLMDSIKIGEEFKDHQRLSEKLTTAADLEKATSDEGLKLLRAEHRELDTFLTSINTLLTTASEFWALEPACKAKAISAKQAAQRALAEALIPEGATLDKLINLLRAASPICPLDEPSGHACPLCKRALDAPEVELFKQYHDLLEGELEKDIVALKADIDKAHTLATNLHNVDRAGWDKSSSISAEIIAAAKTESETVTVACTVSEGPTAAAGAAFQSLERSATVWKSQLDAKKNAIDAAEKGCDELKKQLEKLREEIAPLDYAKTIFERLDELKVAQGLVNRSQFWSDNLPVFTQVLRKITDKAKSAYEELVVNDFETRLNVEYKALAEKDMSAFGVTLSRKGTEASVTVFPKIGGKDIGGVLSEGEQRIHALALFFAELETGQQSVVVFDDPISSFDYNYIANYCIRLRNLAQQHSNRQIIVLTHNWEFFVQLQTTLNQASLGNHLSVQVLENCAVVADYSEMIDVLKKDIEAVLSLAGEPPKLKKEEIAGKMRRLIEAVVNTHVFNHERHQFKQKGQSISEFQRFTKVVPLLPSEATTLRDLYAKLSISGHDDPRTAYINTDKAMFQTRYNAILAVETAIVGRK